VTPPGSNADLSELLCLAAEESGRSDQQRRALRRAGRAAFRWPVEASDLVREERSLTELRSVGPWISGMLSRWMADTPRRAEPPPVRWGFLTRVECDQILAADPGRVVRGDLQVHTVESARADSIRVEHRPQHGGPRR
jgi:hypothetical protein